MTMRQCNLLGCRARLLYIHIDIESLMVPGLFLRRGATGTANRQSETMGTAGIANVEGLHRVPIVCSRYRLLNESCT